MRHAHRSVIHHHSVNVAGVRHGLHDPIPHVFKEGLINMFGFVDIIA